jgi:drug/metabolite transporter (DMT)-like permease
MGISLALLAMLCFAANILILRGAMARMAVESGFLVMLMVNVVFTAILWSVELALRSAPFVFQWKGAAWFLSSGVVGIYFGRRMLIDTIRTLGPARTSVLHSSSPVFTLIGAWLLVGERLGTYELALMLLVIIGLWVTQAPPRGGLEEHRPSREALRRGAILGLLLVAAFGTGNALRGVAIRTWHEAIFGSLFATSAAALCQAASIRDWRKVGLDIVSGDRRGLALFAASGIATAGGSMLTTFSMGYVEIAIAALITFTTPIAIFPVSVFALKNREGLSPRSVAGAGMVLAGIALLALR